MIFFIIIIFFFLENVFERLHNIQKCVVYAKILSWQDITNADGAVSIIDTLSHPIHEFKTSKQIPHCQYIFNIQ